MVRDCSLREVHSMQKQTSLLTTLDEQVHPDICALVIVDMQNDFCHEDGLVLRAKAEADGHLDMAPLRNALQNQLLLLKAARQTHIRICHVRSFWDEHYLNPPLRLRKLRIGRTKDPVSENTWGAEPYLGFEPRPEEMLITKHVYSAFMQTDLQKRLNELGVLTVIVTGVLTSVCVETTIRDANSLGFYVVEPRDCVADLDSKAHEHSLRMIDAFFGVVASSREIMNCWKKHSG